MVSLSLIQKPEGDKNIVYGSWMQCLMRTEHLQIITVCLHWPSALTLSTWSNLNTSRLLITLYLLLETSRGQYSSLLFHVCLWLQLGQKHHQSLVLGKSQYLRNDLLNLKDTFFFIRFWMFFPKNRTLYKTIWPQETNATLWVRQLASSCPQVLWHTFTTSVSRLA